MIKNKISVIVVNYNGFKYLCPLLDSFRKQTYKNFEVIFVDNNSFDESVNFVKKYYPEVRILKNTKNLGFAGGNNSALSLCDGEYVALINNDMIADSRWLEKMYDTLLKERADVVGSKMLFYKPFVSLRFETETFNPSGDVVGGTDTRDLGCKIGVDIGFEGVSYKKNIFFSNVFEEEKEGNIIYRWFGDNAIIKVPVDEKMDSFTLKINLSKPSGKAGVVKIYIGQEKIFQQNSPDYFKEFTVGVKRELVQSQMTYVINNAGSEFDLRTGSGRDIGMNEDDRGQYDTTKEAFAICGGSMLIKRCIIEKYGLFDDYFFAYYEDTDFCWRIKTKNKKMFFEPHAIVFHVHTGTSKEWSPFFRYHVTRNRLAMILKNGMLLDICREWLLFFVLTLKDIILLIKSYIFIKGRNSEISNIRKINIKVAADLLVHMPILFLKRFVIFFKK